MTLEDIEKATVETCLKLLILEGYGDKVVAYENRWIKVRELQNLSEKHGVDQWPATSVRLEFSGGPPPAPRWFRTNFMNFTLDCVLQAELRSSFKGVLKAFRAKAVKHAVV
jgi:hypothetical protein